MKLLVAGWFSFREMGATAGDLLCRDVVCRWLASAGHPYDLALAAPFQGGVDWQVVDPAAYSHVLFVCGPCGNAPPLSDFLARFSGCRLIGLSLSMLESLATWNPFDLLFERDSSLAARPDISFLGSEAKVPVVGLIQIDSQPEYGERDRMQAAHAALARLVASRDMAVVPIDTRLDLNRTGQRSVKEIDSLVAKMDVVLTTRMHGMVLALTNGVPAVVIDPVSGGAKVQRQAETVGWPVVFAEDDLDDRALAEAFDYCLTGAARRLAIECRERAIAAVEKTRDELLSALAHAADGARG